MGSPDPGEVLLDSSEVLKMQNGKWQILFTYLEKRKGQRETSRLSTESAEPYESLELKSRFEHLTNLDTQTPLQGADFKAISRYRANKNS